VATSGEPPLNVVCLFEGEEEIGSPGLETVLRRHARALRADAAVLSDTSMPDPTRPAITYALRGLLSCEVETRGGRREVHSGTYGGAIANPLHGLCTLVDSLHDGEGRIAIDGLYDRVVAPSRGERARLRREGPTNGAVAAEAGVTQGWGEPGWSLFERTVLRPSLSVTGIMGGYSGSGVKSAIGARGLAKLSLRLVPDQRPGEIAQLLRRHLAGLELPGGLGVGMRVVSAAPPVVVDVSHPAMRAAEAACVAGFGGPPALLRSGGSIQTHLGIDTIVLGFGLPSDRAHGPDERLHIPTFLRGVRTSIHLLARLPDALGVKRRTPTPGSPRNALWSAGRLPWEETACV
jgi:acetylornithine deacetylase/succinyl-diaminopimelate desuccinylase-like protein